MIQYVSGDRIKRNGHPDARFVVAWEVAVEAQNYVEAAAKARAIQMNPANTAVCFVVQKGHSTKIVDFGESSTLDNPNTPDE